MSKRAEIAALKAYPNVEQPVWDESFPKTLFVRRTERNAFAKDYEQAEKDTIERIREQVKQWMPKKDGEEHTCGERLAFNSVLHLMEEMEEE